MPATEWSRHGDAWDFLEALCGLTAEGWLGVAGAVRSPALSDAACRELIALVRQDGVTASAWNIDDGLETVAWHMSRHLEVAGMQRRRALARIALEAARTAALALLVRRRLSEKQFWRWYEPFQIVCPQRRTQSERSTRVFTKSLCGATSGGGNVQESLSKRRT